MRPPLVSVNPTVRVGQRQLRDDPRDLRGLAAVGLQKLAARRQVVEQVVDLDHRALGRADLDHRRDRAAVHANLRAARQSPRPRPQHEMRDRRNRRQRLAPEAEGGNRREIVGPPDLARRVALDRQQRIVGLHPVAVVLDADLLLAAELDVNQQPPGAGVDGVLDQFLDHRCGPLDHFPGGNLVGQVARKARDFSQD